MLTQLYGRQRAGMRDIQCGWDVHKGKSITANCGAKYGGEITPSVSSKYGVRTEMDGLTNRPTTG
jgi:hypothetical protein